MGRQRRNPWAELVALALIVLIIVFRPHVGSEPTQFLKQVPFFALIGAVGFVAVMIGISFFRSRIPVQSSPRRQQPTVAPSTLKVSTAPSVPQPDVGNIDWFQFERLMERIYRKEGYGVDRRGGAHADGGIDLVLERGIDRIAVQCKHWKSSQVGIKTVREFLGAMTAEHFNAGILRGNQHSWSSLSSRSSVLFRRSYSVAASTAR